MRSSSKVARAEGNAAKKVTSMMRSAALVLAFLETKAAAARRGSVFDELRATAACRRPSSDNGAAAGVGADDGATTSRDLRGRAR